MKEFPLLEKVSKAKKPNVIAVCNGSEGADLPKFLERNKLAIPVLLDEGSVIKDKFDVFAFPSHIVIDKNGKFVEVIEGELSEAKLAEIYQKMQK